MSFRQSLNVETKGDTVFLNIVINNDKLATTAVPATISTVLQTPLVQNPSDYSLIISRFSIPGRTIPLYFFETVPFPANNNPKKGIYDVNIEYMGQTLNVPVSLTIIPESLSLPQVAVYTSLEPNQNSQDMYYYMYSYVNLANMVTTALRTAIDFANVEFTETPLPEGVDAYMIYSSQSQLFSIVGTTNMYNSSDPTDPANVRIWFNTPLANFFTGFKLIHNTYNALDARDELVLIENNLNNSPSTQDGFNPNIPDGYYQIQEEFNADSYLQTLGRIIITSSSFGGVVPQSEVTVGDRGINQPIVADFIPTSSTQTGEYRSKFQYYVGSEFFRRNLTTTTPLSNLNLSFFWQGSRPEIIRPIYIRPGDNLSIQWIFEKRRN